MITATLPALDDLDAKVLGVQKAKIEKRLKDTNKPKAKAEAATFEFENEDDLWWHIGPLVLNVHDDAVLLATFDTPEEAETIGLRMDVRGKGSLGVGIKGKKVSFWKRLP